MRFINSLKYYLTIAIVDEFVAGHTSIMLVFSHRSRGQICLRLRQQPALF